MIIIGTTELTLGSRRGEFYCPSCRSRRPFRHKVRRAFLTLYFIPLIPLGKTAEFVLCDGCQEAFEPWAVDRSAAEVEQMLQSVAREHIFRVMILTAIADDNVSREEIEAIGNYMQRLGAPPITEAQIHAEIEQAKEVVVSAAQYAGHVADQLNDQEREQMVAGAFLVASASGELSPGQLDDLRLLPLALGISEDEFRRIVAVAAESS